MLILEYFKLVHWLIKIGAWRRLVMREQAQQRVDPCPECGPCRRCNGKGTIAGPKLVEFTPEDWRSWKNLKAELKEDEVGPALGCLLVGIGFMVIPTIGALLIGGVIALILCVIDITLNGFRNDILKPIVFGTACVTVGLIVAFVIKKITDKESVEDARRKQIIKAQKELLSLYSVSAAEQYVIVNKEDSHAQTS